MEWKDIKIVIGGVEVKGVKGICISKGKAVNVSNRLRSVAQIVIHKRNLN